MCLKDKRRQVFAGMDRYSFDAGQVFFTRAQLEAQLEAV
jgi:hypothetical protein